MEREAFTFYSSFYKTAQKIDLPLDRLAFYEAVAQYGLTKEEPDLSNAHLADIAFEGCKPNLDSGWMKSEAGSKGGRSKSNSACADKKSRIKSASNSEKAESNLLSEKSKQYNQEQEQEIKERDTNVSPKKKFQKPTVDEVRAYCEERHNAVDPDAFVDFYESKGWKVGDQPMKDWKAAVRTWERSESKRGQPQRGQAMKGQQRGTDYDAMIAQSVMPDRYTDRSRDFIRRNMGGLMEAT